MVVPGLERDLLILVSHAILFWYGPGALAVKLDAQRWRSRVWSGLGLPGS